MAQFEAVKQPHVRIIVQKSVCLLAAFSVFLSAVWVGSHHNDTTHHYGGWAATTHHYGGWAATIMTPKDIESKKKEVIQRGWEGQRLRFRDASRAQQAGGSRGTLCRAALTSYTLAKRSYWPQRPVTGPTLSERLPLLPISPPQLLTSDRRRGSRDVQS